MNNAFKTCASHCLWNTRARMLSHFSRVWLCDPMDCSPPGSSVHGILQARILEWAAMLSSRGSSWPRDQTRGSCTASGFFTAEPPGKPMWNIAQLKNTNEKSKFRPSSATIPGMVNQSLQLQSHPFITSCPFFFQPYGGGNGLPCWLNRKRICLQCRRCGFDSWVGKIPWRRKWQPTPVFLPGESHGQRSLVGCSPRGHKESDWAIKPPLVAEGAPAVLGPRTTKEYFFRQRAKADRLLSGCPDTTGERKTETWISVQSFPAHYGLKNPSTAVSRKA